MLEYQKALAEFPEDATARGGMGFCYMQTKQWQLALGEYEYILKHDPGNVIALSKTAELYGLLNRREDAYGAYLHLADLYSQAGQGARAEAAWQKAVQLSPGNPEPHERLAGYYFEKKDIAAMIHERLAAAQGYLLGNHPGQARVQCEEVLRADARNVQAQQLLTQIGRTSGPLSSGSGAMFSIEAGGNAANPATFSPATGYEASNSQPLTGNSVAETMTSGNKSGGNTGIMGNMGSAGNFGGVNNPGSSLAQPGAGNGVNSAPRKRLSASQVTGVLKQAQTFQTQGRFNDAIDLCEQILESGFDRPDARYFLGWLYQEQQRWEEAIRQFQLLLNDPDYALSCYYALGQCYRARGDLRTATVHFDEAVDRVNLDALTVEESDQLVQLCQEAAEAHRLLGEQEQALTVYNALLGFLRSRGWADKVAQVEFMLQQAQNASAPSRPLTPPVNNTRMAPPEQTASMAPFPMANQQPPMPEAATMAFNVNNMGNGSPSSPLPAQQSLSGNSSVGDLPDWLTGILSDADKTQIANKPAQPQQMQQTQVVSAPLPEPRRPSVPLEAPAQPASPSWLTEDAKAANANTMSPSDRMPSAPIQAVSPAQQMPAPSAQSAPAAQPVPSPLDTVYPIVPPASSRPTEDLLTQIAGGKAENLARVAEVVLTSTASLPESIRLQVVRSMQDIQNYINHGLLSTATEECLRVIDMAPQYLDVHQVLCEIYILQGQIEQAITKYGILVDTYIVNGRTDDAIAIYRRILQLEPNNLTYRMRLINLLSSQGNKEDLLRERTQAAESYLRLGYMDRALTELEQALQESPTSVATRLNYALALQKLGRTQQAVTEYQRVLQVDPRNITALVRWHIAMITTIGSARSTSLEVLTRIQWQLRGEGQKHADAVIREYNQCVDIYPNNADLHFALGLIYHQAGQFDKAIDAYILAMRDSAVEVLARVSAAQSLLIQGKPEAAIQQLEQASQSVRQSPNLMEPAVWAARPRAEGEQHRAPEVEIAQLLANAYARTGRTDQRDAILRQIKQSQPLQNEVTSTLAEISSRQNDVNGALQEYLDLVHHYRGNRQADNALTVLNEMVRLSPQDPRAHDELADIYVNRGLLEEGIAELRLLADINLRRNNLEKAGTTLQRVGNIYAEMGNNEEALASLRRAAELSPEFDGSVT